jgi:hypothetical protein
MGVPTNLNGTWATDAIVVGRSSDWMMAESPATVRFQADTSTAVSLTSRVLVERHYVIAPLIPAATVALTGTGLATPWPSVVARRSRPPVRVT